jgi:hypothetical protein
MSMPIVEKLQSNVHCHAPAYAAARAHNPLFAAYPTPGALACALSPKTGDKLTADRGRSALVSALVIEAQRSRHPLWTTLLAVAFAPMLRRIRRQTIPCRGDTAEDVEQRVLAAFAEAVQRTSPAHPATGLRWATQRVAWAAGEAEVKEDTSESSAPSGRDEDGAQVWFDGESFEIREMEEPFHGRCENPFAEEDAMLDRITARRIAEELDARGQRELLGALMSEGDGQDSLRAFVERTFPALPPPRRRAVYQRLRTEQRRAVRRLRVRHARAA